MAETGRLTRSRSAALTVSPVTLLRVAIIVAIVVVWEATAHSGLLYRDVVPSLVVIGRAVVGQILEREFYWHLGWTGLEIGGALVIGGLSGLIVG
ncbi:MAG: hypothetical protein WD207_07425, partial [Xanthobacteraceae bacterium]